MPIDKSTFASSSPMNPAAEATEVTPADVDLEQYTRGIYIGGAGDLAVVMADKENTVTFKNLVAGSLLPIRVSQIKAATTATFIVALY